MLSRVVASLIETIIFGFWIIVAEKGEGDMADRKYGPPDVESCLGGGLKAVSSPAIYWLLIIAIIFGLTAVWTRVIAH